jgi:hypothetical protein
LTKKKQLTYPKASLKDVQATEEAFSPQKRTSSKIKTWNFLTLFYFRGSFLPSWIRIQPTKVNADPKPCISAESTHGIAAFLFVLRTLLAVEQLVGQHDVEVLPDPRCHLQDGLLLVVLARRFRFVRRLGSATGGKNFSNHKKCSSLIKMCKKKNQHVIRTDIW